MPEPLVWTVAIFVASFFCMLVHELGHAWVALRRTDAAVVVLVGNPLGILRFGRLSVGLGLGLTGGACYHVVPPCERDQAAVAAAGPAASLLAGLAAAGAFAGVAHASLHAPAGVFFAVLAACALVDVLANGVPRADARGVYGDGGNDGHQVAVSMGWRAPSAVPAAVPAGAGPGASVPPPASGTVPGATPAPAPPAFAPPWALAVLALVFVFSLVAVPLAAVGLVVLFGLAWLMQREQEQAANLQQARAPEDHEH
jgi:hypothetical protein